MEVAVFALVPILAVLAAVTWILWQVLRGLGWLFARVFRGVGFVGGRVFRFARTEVVESIQLVGGVLTAAVLVPLTVVNLAIGRWRTGRHYARAVEDEAVAALLGVYRIGLRHPLHLVGLGGVLDGLERRIPEVVDRAPKRSRVAKGNPIDFDGYELIGTLPAGGSGAQLYLARPEAAAFERARIAGREMPAEVVIKSFALVQGSTLPQIVRESRALEAANRLGLVVEHHLEEGRFYYVMRYVRGDDLDQVVQRMHAASGPQGLGNGELANALVYAQDVLRSLDRFHQGGLWHKDVKPANLIVSEGRTHLVDFGLVTPLQSALTLTTHGTEYYRDPEMVRLAMQGVKVHEVDGVKFDLYSAGAVLFSMIENSFPAHGSLSQLSKRCPQALAFVIRRAMADISSRYGAAWEMLEDVKAIADASDPFALTPADLPSVQRGEAGGQRPAYHAAEASRREERVAEPVAAGSARMPSRPYMLADERVTNPGGPQRGRRRRVLVSLVTAFIIAFGLARGLDEHNSSSVHDGRVAAAKAERPRLYGLENEAFDDTLRVLDAVSIDDDFANYTDLWSTHLSKLELAASKRRSAPHLKAKRPAEARVLILEDGVDDVAPRALESVLADQGVGVIASTSAEAGARHAVGLGGLEDRAAHARLQAFLDAESELDAILWLSGAESAEVPEYRVLMRREREIGPALRLE